eukprot:jgi/Chlat1/3512/Chrsp23S03694
MSSGSSAPLNSRQVQANADAQLNAAYEAAVAARAAFDYSSSVLDASKGSSSDSMQVSDPVSYTHRIQRPGSIQPHGATIVVKESDFMLLSMSANLFELLDAPGNSPSQMAGIGMDARQLFTASSATHLEKAIQCKDLGIVNPIAVFSAASGKPHFAILHRVDVGLVIDLEPVHASATSPSQAGALASHKLASDAISRLQALPGGDVRALCDSVVEEVRSLTGYDRVMIYKFHDDEHGEVVAESVRSDLEPFFGLHYPATDTPQAARALFVKNRVRMIADCDVPNVPMLQDQGLKQAVNLSKSTLRGVLQCHKDYMHNMGSRASLVMAVVVNESTKASTESRERKLWGLCVCHHVTPRVVLYPLRSACAFLMQVFGLQLNAEMDKAAQQQEKEMLRTQTLLCDMLQRDAPIGIVTQSPSIMDLLKCDGAGLWYGGRYWPVGVAPNEDQVRRVVSWMMDAHSDSTGLSTDCLADAGCPVAGELEKTVCGLAACRITDKDYLLWFRGPTEKTVNWAGAAHSTNIDDPTKMNPRKSFATFLEVVRGKSLPWEDRELDAIHSLQLILRGSFQDIEDADTKTMLHMRLQQLRLRNMGELSTVANEMVRLMETAGTPIFAVTASGVVSAWNAKVAELTGVSFADAMGRHLLTELVAEESQGDVERLLSRAMQGMEEDNVEIALRTRREGATSDRVIMVVNTCASRDVNEQIVGVCCVGQDITQHKQVLDKYTRCEGDYSMIVHSPNPLIPPIFGTDEFGRVTEFNPNMCTLSGLTKDIALGKMLVGEVFGMEAALLRLQDEEVRVNFEIVLNRAIDGHESINQPFAFYARDSSLQRVRLNVSPRRDSQGAITGVFCFMQHVSAELESVLRLQMAAQEASEARGKELAYLRKEIANPLDGIRCSTSFLARTELSDDQSQLVATMSACENQLRTVVQEGELEAIEKGAPRLVETQFSLTQLINTVVSQTMLQAEKLNLRVAQNMAPSIKNLVVSGDPVRLAQVLSIFAQYAVRLTPRGYVEIGADIGDEATGRYVFKVTYTGEPLARELTQELFAQDDVFHQNTDALGLSVARRLVKSLNGTLSYQTEPNKGFSFNVEQPLVLVH